MSTLVMAELDPAIHVTCDSGIGVNEDVDHRVKPGDDDLKWSGGFETSCWLAV